MRRTSLFALVAFAALALAVAEACYVGPIDGKAGPQGRATDVDGTTSDGDPSTVEGAATGLPCDVDALLTKRCRSCHVAGGSGPMPLVTYEDLTAASKSDPSKTNAAASIERLRSDTRPMPPSPLDRATSQEIAAFETWVASSTPRGTCGVGSKSTDGGSATIPLESVCTSGTFWSGNRRGPMMQPGRACITCHESKENEPVVWVGGTVYPTLREPDGCYGIAGGASVVITDATGRVVTLPVGTTGNFSLDAKDTARLTMPIVAKVVKDGVERVMATPQNSGNCNGCHTETGANGAPGRILVP